MPPISVDQDGKICEFPQSRVAFVKNGRACGQGAWAGKFCGRLIGHEGPHLNVDVSLVHTNGAVAIYGPDFGEEKYVQPATVIGFTGFAQSGKDTAAGFLAEIGFQRLAFADALRSSLYNLNPIVKAFPGWEESDLGFNQYAIISGYVRVQELVDRFGWDVVKIEHPEVRELLQRFGTEVGRELYGENFWVDLVMAQIQPGGKYIITDPRFPNEVDAIHAIGGKVVRVVRPGYRPVNGHISDTGIANLEVDLEISNDSDLETYRKRVLSAVTEIA